MPGCLVTDFMGKCQNCANGKWIFFMKDSEGLLENVNLVLKIVPYTTQIKPVNNVRLIIHWW